MHIQRNSFGAKSRCFRIGDAFTLIELLVVIAIVSLLVSILLPSLTKARELAKSAACMSHMRGAIGAHTLYAQDHDGTLPQFYYDDSTTGNWQWSRTLMHLKYVEDQRRIMCPAAKDYENFAERDSDQRNYNIAFGMIVSPYWDANHVYYRTYPLRLDQIPIAEFSLLADATRAYSGTFDFERDCYCICQGYRGYTMLRHLDLANVALVDGSVAACEEDELVRLSDVWPESDEYSREDIDKNVQYPGMMVPGG